MAVLDAVADTPLYVRLDRADPGMVAALSARVVVFFRAPLDQTYETLLDRFRKRLAILPDKKGRPLLYSRVNEIDRPGENIGAFDKAFSGPVSLRFSRRLDRAVHILRRAANGGADEFIRKRRIIYFDF